MKTRIICLIICILCIFSCSQYACKRVENKNSMGPSMSVNFYNNYSYEQIFDLCLQWLNNYDSLKFRIDMQDKEKGLIKGKYSFMLENNMHKNLITNDVILLIKKDSLNIIIDNIYCQMKKNKHKKSLIKYNYKQDELNKEWDKLFSSFFTYLENYQYKFHQISDTIKKSI
jgi:hypothetical protein